MDMDFVVSQPLEHCAYRLGLAQELRELPFVPQLILRLSRVDADTYEFEFHEGDALPISVQGALNRLDRQRTYVSLRVRMDRPRVLVEQGTLLLLTLGLSLLFGPLMVCISLPLLLIAFMRYHHAASEEFGRLVHLLRGTLA